MALKLVNWNVRCATPGSWKRRDEIWNRIFQHDPHIVCLTETHRELLSRYGPNTICSRPSCEKVGKEGPAKGSSLVNGTLGADL